MYISYYESVVTPGTFYLVTTTFEPDTDYFTGPSYCVWIVPGTVGVDD